MEDHLKISRIGRPPTPAEKGLQLVVERPEVLTEVTLNFLANQLNLCGSAVERVWARLNEGGREEWKSAALAALRRDLGAPCDGPEAAQVSEPHTASASGIAPLTLVC